MSGLELTLKISVVLKRNRITLSFNFKGKIEKAKESGPSHIVQTSYAHNNYKVISSIFHFFHTRQPRPCLAQQLDSINTQFTLKYNMEVMSVQFFLISFRLAHVLLVSWVLYNICPVQYG